MILYLNTSIHKQIDVFLLHKNKLIAKKALTGNYKVSEKLLKLIEKLLLKANVLPKKLKGIIVVIGPGAFTSLRIGVMVANTLAYLLQIPIVGVIRANDQTTNQELLSLGLKKLQQMKKSNFVRPFYNQEPNITPSKQ